MSALLRAYLNLLNSRPLTTKFVTSAILFGSGDLIAQNIDGTMKRGWNPRRTGFAAAWGGFIFTPIGHTWYNIILERSFVGTSAASVVKKTLCDQLLFAPVINAAFLTYGIFTRGGDLKETKSFLRANYKDVMVANYSVWPAAMLFNFKFVPGPLQVPFINVMVLAWSSYLCVKANAGTTKPTSSESAGATIPATGASAPRRTPSQ